MTDLRPRLVSAVVMVVAAVATLWAGGPWFAAFWLAAALAIHWEWQRLVGGPHGRARLAVGSVALVIATAFTATFALDVAIATVVLGAAVLAVLGGPGRRLWSAAALPYAAALSLSVVLLRASFLDAVEAIAWLFAVVWGTDVLAYFGGRAIGGPKLWARVSPGKTWSGFVTGIVGGALCGWLVAAFTLRGQGWPVFGLGLLAAALAQAGDLAESAIKRRFGVKDSSQLIPGHGGVMDRLDGFVVASAFAAVVGVARFGLAQAGHGLFAW